MQVPVSAPVRLHRLCRRLQRFRQRGRFHDRLLYGSLLYRCAHKGLHRRSRSKRLHGSGLCGTGDRCCLHWYGLPLLRRFRQAEQRQFQLNALVTAAGHVLQCRAQGADGPDGLPLAQLRTFFQILRLLFR